MGALVYWCGACSWSSVERAANSAQERAAASRINTALHRTARNRGDNRPDMVHHSGNRSRNPATRLQPHRDADQCASCMAGGTDAELELLCLRDPNRGLAIGVHNAIRPTRFGLTGIALLLLLAAALLLPSVAAAQATPTPKLPPANPLPYVDADANAVLAPINALFAAFEAGDVATMLRHVYPDGRVTASGMRGDGASNLRQQSWTQFAKRIKPDTAFQERIADPVIDIDGDIAMVWAPFVVRVGGKVSNCGVDHFDLVRENAAWKVMNLTFSSRTTGCPAQ